MGMISYLFDTCSLIDLEGEKKRGEGRAHAFLSEQAEARACICWMVAGEFAEGFDDLHAPACAAMLSLFDFLPCDEEVARHYALIARRLRSTHQLIGANDLWIAATALAHRFPVVTNNQDHFGRVPGLMVVGYK